MQPGNTKNFRHNFTVLYIALQVSQASLFLPAVAQPCVNCPPPLPEANNNRAGNNSGLQGKTQNTSLQTGTESTSLQVGTENTVLQTGTESALLQGGAQGNLLKAAVDKQTGPSNILFLIDASQSMKEKLGPDDQKMDEAKRTLQQILSRIPNDVNIGLRVFGHSFSNDPYTDCQQSALLVPLGTHNRGAIMRRLPDLKPYGLTPLTYGLMQASRDLEQVQGTKTIILLSDGAETCGGDPCAYIRLLQARGIKTKVDIVGLGLRRDRSAKDQLNCIAASSGGKYYDANTAAELVDSVTKSVKQAISGKVITRIPQNTPEQSPAANPATSTQDLLKELPKDFH